MKTNLFTLLFLIWIHSDLTLYAQVTEPDSIYGIVLKPVVEITDPGFQDKYNKMVYKMRRIYPMAIHAKELLATYEKDIADLEKKRQIKKYGKTAQEKLVEDFEYLVRDMYVSDGQLLVKLIHRETGLTVYEIVKKYRGGLQATWYQGIGVFFDQNMKTVYDPKKEDWLIEFVAKEIESGKHKLVAFKVITKEQYRAKKLKQKELRNNRKNAQKERNKVR
jgi:hypothetical protein